MLCLNTIFSLYLSFFQIPVIDSLPLGDRKVVAYPSISLESNSYLSDEPFILYYNHLLEKKSSLKDKTDFAVFIRAEAGDGLTYRSTNLLSIKDAIEFFMTEEKSGIYRYAFIPDIVFGNIVPKDTKIKKMEISILGIPYCGNQSCQVDGLFVYTFPCN
ncbi:MAG: hypothetical protein IPH93_03810 [Saprospiraceae bacterium]|nr:hypothetical protein [Saprospiraceae bacterium]MBK7811893.1 hypothetical protein [Saprospiraceae bacterium]MBK9631898.1 hypothetical protein [Saprospiraceae bacterium]